MNKAKGLALKVMYAKALIAKVERDLGHKLINHRIDLLLDNSVCHSVEQAKAVLKQLEE